MANPLDTLRTGIRIGLTAARNADDITSLEANLDQLIEENGLPIEEKSVVKHDSKLNIRTTGVDSLYGGLSAVVGSFYRYSQEYIEKNQVPPIYTQAFDNYTSQIWQQESILAGAVYSMSAKMTALSWQVTGLKKPAVEYAKLLSRAAYNGGYGWGGFASSTAEDFYTLNRGTFWETARANRFTGPMEDIGYIDGLSCHLTGNSKEPVWYISQVTGQSIRFKPGEFVHFASMPSGREENLGAGFCAVARALRAARLLIGLSNYDSEKLANLPPEGVATVTGLTMDEFNDAIALWMAARKKDNSLTFPQVLWLIGSNPSAKVEVGFTGFSQIPESFDRKTVVEQYVNTLALVFGVDAREFWPISTSSMGTAAESEIQHMKAKGKGPGEFISLMERNVNGELPEGIDFSFDTQDIEEDLQAAQTAQAWIAALLPLATQGTPQPQLMQPPQLPANGQNQQKQAPEQPGGDAFISKDDFIRLLVDKGVLPDWISKDKRTAVQDSDIHEKDWGNFGDYDQEGIIIKWDRGILTARRMPAVTIITDNLIEVPFARTYDGEYFQEKGGPGSGFHGHSGRPGKVGGSSGGGAGSDILTAIVPVDVPDYADGYGIPELTEKYDDPSELNARFHIEHEVPIIIRGEEHPGYTSSTLGGRLYNDRIELRSIHVDPKLRRRGIATALIKRVAAKYPDLPVTTTGVFSDDGKALVAKLTNDGIINKEHNPFEDHLTQLKQREQEILEANRNIRGKPIPGKEAARGSNVTAQTIKDELERWRKHPILSQYVEGTEQEILASLNSPAEAPSTSSTLRNGVGARVIP